MNQFGLDRQSNHRYTAANPKTSTTLFTATVPSIKMSLSLLRSQKRIDPLENPEKVLRFKFPSRLMPWKVNSWVWARSGPMLTMLTRVLVSDSISLT